MFIFNSQFPSQPSSLPLEDLVFPDRLTMSLSSCSGAPPPRPSWRSRLPWLTRLLSSCSGAPPPRPSWSSRLPCVFSPWIECEDWKGILDELVIFLSYPGNYCFELQLDGNVVQMTDFAAQWAVSRPQRYLLPLNMLRTYSFSCLILVSVLVLIIKLRKRWKRKCRLLCIVVRIAFVISFLFEIS